MSQHHGFGRQSTIGDRNVFMADSDLDTVSHAELAQSIVDRRATVQPERRHEIAVGDDAVMRESVSIGTECQQIKQFDAACNTARVKSSDVMINTCVEMADNASQSNVQVRDMGCDNIIPEMQNQASQM